MNLWSANENAASKILVMSIEFFCYNRITNVKLCSWLVFNKHAHTIVHLDMTCNRVLYYSRRCSVYNNWFESDWYLWFFVLPWISVGSLLLIYVFFSFDWLMVSNATFNIISAISWRSVLLVEETRLPGENHQPAACQLPCFAMPCMKRWRG